MFIIHAKSINRMTQAQYHVITVAQGKNTENPNLVQSIVSSLNYDSYFPSCVTPAKPTS